MSAQSQPTTHRIGAFIAVLVTIIGLTLFSAGSAAAQIPDSAIPTDGCTLVPDQPIGAGADFKPACDDHDRCYFKQEGRSYCDLAFYRAMVQICKASTHYYTCRSWAAVYYAGVRLFGQPYYNASNVNTRVLTPMNA